jgi:hypothetical protein
MYLLLDLASEEECIFQKVGLISFPKNVRQNTSYQRVARLLFKNKNFTSIFKRNWQPFRIEINFHKYHIHLTLILQLIPQIYFTLKLSIVQLNHQTEQSHIITAPAHVIAAYMYRIAGQISS